MNGQHHGISGQQYGRAPETSADGATAPTPVTSSAGTASTTPVGSGYDAGRPAQHAAPGWESLVQDPNTPAEGWGAPAREQSAPSEGWGAPAREQSAPAEGWGSPAAKQRTGSAPQSWTVKRGLAVAGAAVVLAAGAGAGVYALTSGSSSSTAADGTTGASGGGLVAPGGPGSAQGGFGGGAVPGQGGTGNFAPQGTAGVGGLSAAVHAEYVVLQGSAYVTKAEQLGTVTEVSSAAVTVKSSDGFSRSYALGADVLVTSQQQRRQQTGNTGSQLSVADIVAGGAVRIVSSKNGDDYTAESVTVTGTAASGSTSGTGKAS